MKYKIQKSSVLATMLMIASVCFSFTDGYSQLTAACSPSYSNGGSAHYITSVSTGSFSHSPTYNTHDYTSTIITASSGSTMTFTVLSTGWCAVGMAADWNNDGDFDDIDEILALPSYIAVSTVTYSLSVTIPATIAPGSYRLRLWNRLANSGAGNSPCGSYGYGSWVDYTLKIPAWPNNAGVDSLIGPNEDGNFCSGKQPVKVRVSNLGSNSLSSVHVDWSVNGVQQPGQSLVFNPPIDSVYTLNHDTTILLGYVDFPYQTPVEITAWTSEPNGVTDAMPSDDTLDLSVASTKQGPTVEILPNNPTVCESSSILLDAGQQPSGFIFIWSNGAITQQASVSQPGSYNVIVQSPDGCFGYDTVNVDQSPKAVIGAFGGIDEGNGNFKFTPVGMQYVNVYHWDFGDGDSLNVTSAMPQMHHYAHNGTYAVSLTVRNDCGRQTVSKQIYVELPTGLHDVSVLDDALKVYPNPANSKLTIKSQAENVQLQGIKIYDMIGKEVIRQLLKGNIGQISLEHLPAGIYQANIQTSAGVVNLKVAVAH